MILIIILSGIIGILVDLMYTLDDLGVRVLQKAEDAVNKDRFIAMEFYLFLAETLLFLGKTNLKLGEFIAKLRTKLTRKLTK